MNDAERRLLGDIFGMVDDVNAVLDDDDEFIVRHRVTGEKRDRDDTPPVDLREASSRYDFTREFMEDALDALGGTDPADLDPVTRLQVGRWWRSQDLYRAVLEEMCEDRR